MAGRAALVAAALCASALCAAGEGELRGGRDTGFDGPRLELRVEAMLNDAWTPVSVNLRRTPHKVGLCKLDHELRHQDPSAVPMFQEWSRRSGCTGGAVQHVPLVVYEKVVGSIVDRYEKTGTADEGFPPPVPNGIIYHMMRTGSTLWGNMLSRAENVLVYSEPFTIIDAVSGSGLPPDRRAQLLKLLYAGMTRVRGHSSSVLKFPIAATVQVYENMHMAFPGTPWVYIFRRPEEVLASMFRVAGQNPRLRGKKADSKRPPNAPCTRTKGPGAPAPVKTLLREGSGHSPQESSHDEYCAAFLAMLCDSAITWHKQALEAPKEEHPPGMFLNYVSIPHVILAVSRQHFGIPLTEEQARKVAEEGGVYSKSRAKPGKGGQAFKGDAEDKMAQSPDSYHLWSSVYLYERYAAMTALAQGVELLDTAQQEQLKAEVEWVTSARETWSAKLAKGGSVGQGGGQEGPVGLA